MKSNVCPYLGLQEDPATSLDFPSPGNFCHHAQPAAPIKGSFQEKFCLSGEHTACPIFLAAHPIPAPAEMVAPPPPTSSARRWLALIGIPTAIASVAALTLAWNVFGFRPGFSIPNTGQTSIPTSAWALAQGNQPIEKVAAQVPSQAPSAEPTPNNCPRPQGWVPYTVYPTDSLYRLSVIYGVSIEQLQKVNCLDEKAVIMPGQVIFVPVLATDTPTPTATPTPVPPTSTSAPADFSSNSQPQQNDPAPAPNTAVPPPADPPTAVPATNPPPVQVQKPQPPAASQPKQSFDNQRKQSTGGQQSNNNNNNNQKDHQGKGKDKKKGK